MRKQTSSLLAISFLLVPAFGACGNSDKGHTAITGTVDGFAEAVCDFAFRCCSAGEIAYYVAPFVNEANCKERLMDAALAPPSIGLSLPAFHGLTISIPNLGALDRAVREKRTRIDGTALAACRAYLENLTCNAPPPDQPQTVECKPFDPPPEATPCDPSKIFVGNLNEGDVCTSNGFSSECAPGLYCGRNSSLGQYGQCIATGHVGDFCLESYECDTGLYCSLLDGTCQAPRQEGETCVYADHLDPSPSSSTLLVKCRDDLSCDPITHTCVVHCQQGATCGSDDDCDATKKLLCITGRCDTPRAAGLPCVSTADCQDGLRCIPSLADPTKDVCAARLANQQVCQQDTDCQSEFCNTSTAAPYKCAPQVGPGLPCPTGLDSQCLGGSCQGNGSTGCTNDTTCGGGRCDLASGNCRSICVAYKIDNALCVADSDCASGHCIAGFCRTPPLADGVACDSSSDCSSDFCSLDPKPVCTKLPLKNGSRCYDGSQCESLVCFQNPFGIDVCVDGFKVGDRCGSGNQPCDPKTAYCNYDLDVPVCAALRETGETCRSYRECRGSCVIRDGRYMCDDTAAPGAAVCDGQ